MSATPPVNGNPSVEARLNTSGSNGQFKVTDSSGSTVYFSVKDTGDAWLGGSLAIETIKAPSAGDSVHLEGSSGLSTPMVILSDGVKPLSFGYDGSLGHFMSSGENFIIRSNRLDVLSGNSSEDPVVLMRLLHDVTAKTERLVFTYDSTNGSMSIDSNDALGLSSGSGKDISLKSGAEVKIDATKLRIDADALIETASPKLDLKVAGGGATVLTLKNSGSRGQIESGAGLDIESSTDLTLTATNGHLAIEATGSLYLAAGGYQIRFRKGAATEILNIDLTSKEASFYDASNTGVVRVTPNATAGATVFIGDNTQGRGKIELQGKTGTGARAAVVALGAEDGATRYLSLWNEPVSGKYELWLTTSEPTALPTTGLLIGAVS